MSSDTTAPAPEGVTPPPPVPLDEPADGVPVVVETERDLARAAEAVANGEGPVAIDAERASGYRYGQRAYLVQVRREGAGTWLIDPVGCPDLSPLDEAIGAAEWILHAATQDQSEWARQEFTSLLTWTPTERVDPWRRTSGMNTLRSRRSVAIVRELWYARDDIARDRDTSIGRVLPDASLVEIAKAAPSTTADLPRGHRAIARYGRQWVEAVRRAVELPEDDLPPRTLPSDGPPPPRVWAEKNP